MPIVYSLDLRKKIFSAWQAKEGSQRELAKRFNVSLSFIRDLSSQYRKTIEITTEQGFIVRANVNRKTFKKQVEKMDSFADWIAALSGKISCIEPDGVIELETASVAVFEKKPKEEVMSEVEDIIENLEVKP